MAKTERESIKTPLFRGSFVHLIKPREQERDDGTTSSKFSIFIPLKKTDPATKAFIQGILKLVEKASAEKHGKALKPNQLKNFPIKNGDDMENEQFHGHWCVNASANFKPSVCDVHGDPLLTEEEVYSGAWYKAKLSVWAWANKKGGKGISINIESAIKMKDDEKFGGGSDAKDDFSDDITDGGGDAGGGDDDLGI